MHHYRNPTVVIVSRPSRLPPSARHLPTPTPTPASFKHPFGGCACPIAVPLNGTVLFFLAGSRLANTMPPPAKQRVDGRIAVQAELANPSNEQ